MANDAKIFAVVAATTAAIIYFVGVREYPYEIAFAMKPTDYPTVGFLNLTVRLEGLNACTGLAYAGTPPMKNTGFLTCSTDVPASLNAEAKRLHEAWEALPEETIQGRPHTHHYNCTRALDGTPLSGQCYPKKVKTESKQGAV